MLTIISFISSRTGEISIRYRHEIQQNIQIISQLEIRVQWTKTYCQLQTLEYVLKNVKTVSFMLMMDCALPRVSVIDFQKGGEKNQSESTPETIDSTIIGKCFQWMKKYLKKFSGLHEKRPSRLSWSEHFWSFLGCLISIVLVGLLHYHVLEK